MLDMLSREGGTFKNNCTSSRECLEGQGSFISAMPLFCSKLSRKKRERLAVTVSRQLLSPEPSGAPPDSARAAIAGVLLRLGIQGARSPIVILIMPCLNVPLQLHESPERLNQKRLEHVALSCAKIVKGWFSHP